VPEVVREINRGHPAVPELALDHIAVAESFSKRDGDVGHGSGLTGRPSNLWQRAVARQPLGGRLGVEGVPPILR
jgi:hypothetical protein